MFYACYALRTAINLAEKHLAQKCASAAIFESPAPLLLAKPLFDNNAIKWYYINTSTFARKIAEYFEICQIAKRWFNRLLLPQQVKEFQMKQATTSAVFTKETAERLAKQLAKILHQIFNRQGDLGEAPGIYSVVGRGGDSLNDSYRLARPGDKLKDYHNTLNARRPLDGPFFVHTRANLYERRGIIFPDIVGRAQPGGRTANYEREDLTAATTELLLSSAFQFGHQPGVILPNGGQKPQVFVPETSAGMMLKRLRQCRQQEVESHFLASIEMLRQLSVSLEFAFIISDFLSDDPDWWTYLQQWQESLIDLGHRLELVVIQIVDPADLSLPDEGILKIQQGRQIKEIDTGDPQVQVAFAQLVQQQQRDIAAVMQAARAQHFQLMTDRLPELIPVSGQQSSSS